MSPRLRSYAAIGAASLVPLAMYVASARTDVSFWDTADLQTVPYILGIPAPTAFPGDVRFGRGRSHAFASAFGAAAVGPAPARVEPRR